MTPPWIGFSPPQESGTPNLKIWTHHFSAEKCDPHERSQLMELKQYEIQIRLTTGTITRTVITAVNMFFARQIAEGMFPGSQIVGISEIMG